MSLHRVTTGPLRYEGPRCGEVSWLEDDPGLAGWLVERSEPLPDDFDFDAWLDDEGGEA